VRRILKNVVLLLVILLVADMAKFAYRTNYVCDPGEHILQSDSDAIEVAKQLISKESIFGSGEFNNGVDVVDSMNRTDNCCGTTRTRTPLGVIVWDVRVVAEKGNERFYAQMELSNCSSLFTDSKFTTIEPIKRWN
jgi:hypothetical protein